MQHKAPDRIIHSPRLPPFGTLGGMNRLDTDVEVETKEFGVETGRIQIVFLEATN